ncbi:MAG: N-acetylmuramoyl-L-alanine amidase family protein [Chitinophagaceae bacterium]
MRTLFFFLLFTPLLLQAQLPSLKLVRPSRDQVQVAVAKQFITGATCASCNVNVNGNVVKVWPTGAFATEVMLTEGSNRIVVTATNEGGLTTERVLTYQYNKPIPEKTLTQPTVEHVRIEPAGNLLLAPGDKVRITLKTVPGAQVRLEGLVELKELPAADSNSVAGMYKGEYIVDENAEWLSITPKPFRFVVQTKDGLQIDAATKSTYAKMPEQGLLIQTKGRLPYLLNGLGEDRLGGTKIGYLDSMITLKAIAKVNDKYRVRLSRNRDAYIEEVHVQPKSTPGFTPYSLTGSMRSWGDSAYDYVSLSLQERLPYESWQEVNPSLIRVDVFGAVTNTNWVTQLSSAKEIKQVYYRQTEEDVFSIYIELKHSQHWGHAVFYRGNTLIIKVKRTPLDLSLRNKTILVDAGHGGSNKGAAGIMGVFEKDLTLLVSLELQKVLEREGAKVIMTRTKDTTYENHDRLWNYKQLMPDLLISIHLNSADDPIRVQGTSTFYKHIGFKSLTQHVLESMLTLGLKEYGNIGHFNFILNGATEYPSVLVETLFVSHPEDEANILDPQYRKMMAEKITEGVKRWLDSVK